MASFAIDICSPVDISTAVSLLSGSFASSFASPINLSVVFPCADNTTTMFLYFCLYAITLIENYFNVSLSATERPPNFKTTIFSSIVHTSFTKKYIELFALYILCI